MDLVVVLVMTGGCKVFVVGRSGELVLSMAGVLALSGTWII